jgi:hypothetical protein
MSAQAHLVAVVVPADRGAVHPGPDLDPRDHPLLGNPPGLLGSMRMREASRQSGRAGDRTALAGKHASV